MMSLRADSNLNWITHTYRRAIREKCRAILEKCRAIREKCRPIREKCRAIREKCRAIREKCRAIREKCRAIREKCRAILEKCRAIREKCRAIREKCRAIREKCRAIREKCRAIREKCRAIREKCRAIREKCSELYLYVCLIHTDITKTGFNRLNSAVLSIISIYHSGQNIHYSSRTVLFTIDNISVKRPALGSMSEVMKDFVCFFKIVSTGPTCSLYSDRQRHMG